MQCLRLCVLNHLGFLNPKQWPKPSSDAWDLFGHKAVGELVAYWKEYVFTKFKKDISGAEKEWQLVKEYVYCFRIVC